MATGNLVLGTASKKLGDIVLYRQGGKQRARVRVTPKNPKTLEQMLQRIAFGQAAIAGAAMKEVIDHSFESKPYGTDSVRYFTSINAPMLKSTAREILDGKLSLQMASFHAKGFNVVAPNSFAIARGSLATFNPWAPRRAAQTGSISFPAYAGTVEDAQRTNRQWAEIFGLTPGYEYSFHAIFIDPASVLYKTEGYSSDAGFGQVLKSSQYAAVRLVLRPSSDPVWDAVSAFDDSFESFLQTVADPDKTSPSFLASDNVGLLGSVTFIGEENRRIQFSVQAKEQFFVPENFGIASNFSVPAAIGLVVSALDNDKWRNSNSDLVLVGVPDINTDDTSEEWGLAPQYAIETWLSSSVNSSDYFLQQGGSNRV